MVDERDLTRREFIKLTALTLGGIALVGMPGDQAKENISPFKKTEFFRRVNDVARKLNWTVKTAPVTERTGLAKCTTIHDNNQWKGCVEAFDGFQTPFRPQDFKPAGYLVYVWEDSPVTNQKLIIVELNNDLPVPVASGDWVDGSLINTFEKQKEAARLFGFKFPDTQDQEMEDGTIGPLGFWGLDNVEIHRIPSSQSLTSSR